MGGDELKCTKINFLILTTSKDDKDKLAAKLQADIRDTNGQFNRVVPGAEVYRDHHKKVAPIKDYSYRGRMFDPSYVPVFAVDNDFRRKFLFVASDHMNCLVRLRFVSPEDPDSLTGLAPEPFYHDNPYLCDAGSCEPRQRFTQAPYWEGRQFDGDPPPPPPEAPPPPPPGPKQCIKNQRNAVEECSCSTEDDCLTRDSEICFSARGGDLRRPYSVVWTSAD